MQQFQANAPINALSISPSGDRTVIAGRDVLKVLRVLGTGQIEETVNLRAGSRINLNLSCNDVKWNPHMAREQIIATAATNGSIIIWDISRSSGQRQVRIMTDHTRSVNRLSFHSSEPHHLLSASQDGSIKLWDLRSPSSSSGGLVFDGKSESVRDVQFSPNSAYDFASAFDNGNIQIWDIRNNKIYQKRFGAHNGLALSVDWHPDGRYLASGGRDKLIKIWDTRSESRKAFHQIHTIASVARVCWRPNSDSNIHNEITSSSLLSDDRIHCWNVDRSFMPSKSFDEHSSAVTGVLWKDSNTLWSVSKDKSFIVRSYESGYNTSNTISAFTLNWNVWDDICSSRCQNNTSAENQNAINETSSKTDHTTVTLSLSESRVSSMPAYMSMLINSNTVDNNSSIDSKVWTGDSSSLTVPSLADEEANQTTFGRTAGNVVTSYFKRFPKKTTSNASTVANLWPREKELKVAGVNLRQTQTTHIIDLLNADNCVNALYCSRLYRLPEHANLTDLDLSNICRHNSNVCLDLGLEFDSRTWEMVAFMIENRNMSGASSVESEKYLFQLFQDAVEYYASSGNVQMAAMITIMSSNFQELSKESEDIVMLYRDFLQRANRYVEATNISRFSGLSSIKQLTQQSTSIHISCNNCFKPLENTTTRQGNLWYCEKCKQSVNPCSVCDLPVKSIYIWCRDCSHGGHLEHIHTWFSKNTGCPTGCGHDCKVFETI